jgi:hypothetical protein
LLEDVAFDGIEPVTRASTVLVEFDVEDDDMVMGLKC